jgi:hypothetical protein
MFIVFIPLCLGVKIRIKSNSFFTHKTQFSYICLCIYKRFEKQILKVCLMITGSMRF